MITEQELNTLITDALPGAQVSLLDKTGMQDHYRIAVTAPQFEGQSLMDRHRMVMTALQEALHSGRLHAAEIQTAL